MTKKKNLDIEDFISVTGNGRMWILALTLTFLGPVWCAVSHILHSMPSHKRPMLREKCVSVKKRGSWRKTERSGGGDKGGFQRRRAHFETEVWGLAKVRFAFRGERLHFIWTFQKCFSSCPQSSRPPFFCHQYINLSQPKPNEIHLISRDSHCCTLIIIAIRFNVFFWS